MVHLPVYAEEPDRAEKPVQQNETGGNETILLVEDEPLILEITQIMLRELGCTVLAAENAEDALQVIESHGSKIHLLITDVVLPDMNGRILSREICKLIPDIKILFISGYSSDIVAKKGVFEDGALFLQKPFNAMELATRVREALNK